jgi:hypothetical protein
MYDYNKKLYEINANASINEGNLNADGSLSVNIFYSSLSYTNIQEKPSVTGVTLMPDLGGRLGLFLGISFLSLAEVFEVLYEILYFLARKCLVRSSTNKNKFN